MRFTSKIAALLGVLILTACASSVAVIGGTYYATQYDFAEFFAATEEGADATAATATVMLCRP